MYLQTIASSTKGGQNGQSVLDWRLHAFPAESIQHLQGFAFPLFWMKANLLQLSKVTLLSMNCYTSKLYLESCILCLAVELWGIHDYKSKMDFEYSVQMYFAP